MSSTVLFWYSTLTLGWPSVRLWRTKVIWRSSSYSPYILTYLVCQNVGTNVNHIYVYLPWSLNQLILYNFVWSCFLWARQSGVSLWRIVSEGVPPVDMHCVLSWNLEPSYEYRRGVSIQHSSIFASNVLFRVYKCRSLATNCVYCRFLMLQWNIVIILNIYQNF